MSQGLQCAVLSNNSLLVWKELFVLFQFSAAVELNGSLLITFLDAVLFPLLNILTQDQILSLYDMVFILLI